MGRGFSGQLQRWRPLGAYIRYTEWPTSPLSDGRYDDFVLKL